MGKVTEFGFMTEYQDKGSEMIRLAKRAEELGYGTYWVPEDPYYRGPFTTAATVAAHTKAIRIGTGIINPYIRHPVAIAMEMAALDEYSEGRAVCGMGAGGKTWIQDQLNIPAKKPMTMLRESIDIFQQLIRGETVNYEGDQIKLSDVKLSISPYRSKIPHYLGVAGPKSIQLAGETCDGYLIGAFEPITAKNIAYCRDNLTIGTNKTGRDINEIDVTCLMTLSMSKNDREALNQIKPLILKNLLHSVEVGYTNKYRESDLPDTFYKKLGEYARGIGNPLDLITDDVVDCYAVAGSPARCKDRIEELVEAGVNSFVLVDYSNYGASMDVEKTMNVFQAKIMAEFL